MADRIDRAKWRRMWGGLPETTREEIRRKAGWEQMSLSAVVRDWWPNLWRQVVVKDDRDG